MSLAYNGVDLSYTETETHASEPEFDTSGVDVLYTRTAIRVRAVIGPGLYPTEEGESAADTADRIRHLLTTPRRRLVFSLGDTTFFDAESDAANGPLPDAGAFTIKPCGQGSFVVTFGVVVRLTHCTAAASRGFLSLKWRDQETLDRDLTKTRRRTGLLIVSRQTTTNADDRRNLVIPLVPAGFRRETADYTLSEDGLRLSFTFVDKQLHRDVMLPAVKISGSQAETVPLRGGMRRGELSLRLNGAPGTKANDLIRLAVFLAMPRVYATGVRRDENGYMIGGGIRESLDDSETSVELSLQWFIKPAAGRLGSKQQPPATAAGALGGGFWSGFGSGLGTGFQTGTSGDGPASPAGGGGGTIDNQTRPRPTGILDAVTPEGRSRVGLPVGGRIENDPLSGPPLGVPTTTRGVGLAAALRPFASFLYDPCGMDAELSNRPATSELVGTAAGGGRVTVRTGTPQYDDTDAVADDDGPGMWESWRMSYTFHTDSGYGVVPATKPNTAGEMVRFGNPGKKLLIKWACRRTGAPPDLPAPKVPQPGGRTGDGTHDKNWVGRTCDTTYDNVELAADGVSFIYEAAGEAMFEALDATKAGEAYPCPPWLAPADAPKPAAVPQPAPQPPAGQLPPPPVQDFTIKGVPPPNP